MIEPVAPQVRTRNNGFAIASLLLSMFGVLISIVFGIIALVQIKRYGGHGKGLAIAGLVISGIWVALLSVGAFLAITGGAERDAGGSISKAGDAYINELRPGDCVKGLDKPLAYTISVVRCTEPHEATVLGRVKLWSSPWNSPEVEEEASTYCSLYADQLDLSQQQIMYLLPAEAAWEKGDRMATCFAAKVTS